MKEENSSYKYANNKTPETEAEDDASSGEEEQANAHENGYVFENTVYDTYQEMVNAKRQRNQEQLEQSGLLGLVDQVKQTKKRTVTPGLKKRKTSSTSLPPRRKSSRIAGETADGLYVVEERAGKFTVASTGQSTASDVSKSVRGQEATEHKPEFYRNRINDGGPISLQQAVENTGDKWMDETSVQRARDFWTVDWAQSLGNVCTSSPSLSKQQKMIENLQVNDIERSVAKVVPDRIYGIAAHPRTDSLLVSAGDKSGYVGFWNVKEETDVSSSDVHLFRFHKGACCSLEWTRDGSALLSGSYDGTVRWFDVEKQVFEEIFATYDDTPAYKGKLGYALDEGHNFWTQFVCMDPRFSNDKTFFVSTSVGTAMGVDLRTHAKLTFLEELSEKKINTLSLHPNGHSLISGGLDCTVKLWDLRKFGDSRSKGRKQHPSPLATYNGGKSVNSAFFSPSGKYVLSTTMANKLDIFSDFHTGSKSSSKPQHSIRHDNMTGRWLSTFMAQWHPNMDIFCVGSMLKPRCVEIFDHGGKRLRAVQGDALTAVASRCCFHPRTDKLELIGGNSSGRVTVIR